MTRNNPVARYAQGRRKASPKFNEQLVTWLYQMHHDPELTASALAVALEIAWPMSSLGQCSWPSLDTIARNCKLSKPSVIRIVQQLVARGHLIVEGGSAGRGNSTRYWINILGAATEPVTRLRDIPVQVLDPAPTNAKGFVADLLADEPHPQNGTLKGFVADLNKEVRKRSKKEDKQERPFGPPLSLSPLTDSRVKQPVTAALPSPAINADEKPNRDSAYAGRLSGNMPIENQRPTYPLQAAVLEMGRAARTANAAMIEHRNGHAVRRFDNPQPPTRGVPMTTKNMNEAANTELFEKFFTCLLENYPRRDAAESARSVLRDVFAKSSNHGQTRCLLLDSAAAYEREIRAGGKTNFLRLDDFVRAESWMVENLPFNRLQAA